MAFTTTAQNIIDEAEDILQDASNVHWTAAELLKGVNSGCKAVCLFKPDSYVVTTTFKLATGIVQILPDAGFYLQDIICNMGTNGTTLGAVAERIDRKILETMDRSWPTVTASATVIYWMFDERTPRNFLVYPAQPSSNQGYVQALYSAAPAEIAADANILIPDIYRPALVQYVLHYAHSKDADRGDNFQRSTAYYQAFLNSIGVMHDREKVEDPNQK